MWGVQMSDMEEEVRINLILTPEISKRLNNYCLKVANKMGKLPQGLLTAIGRSAVSEWLDAHEKDADYVKTLKLRK